jgi:hypothetical protein
LNYYCRDYCHKNKTKIDTSHINIKAGLVKLFTMLTLKDIFRPKEGNCGEVRELATSI